ncbi:MAG: HAD-IA family hydrolase [Solirubrobacterales bacterium]
MPAPYRACLIDALGTMVRLLPPWEYLDAAATAGVPAERIRSAFEAEMRFYRDNAERGRDADSLAQLRADAAQVLSAGLGREVAVDSMMAAIRFEAYPDAAPALAALRARGLRIVCVSNWDYALGTVLERIGLAPALDGVVTSAAVGARKPDPAIFAAALDIAGCGAADAFHVGDSDEDVEGARAAGIDVIRIDREDGADVSSLAEMVELPELSKR